MSNDPTATTTVDAGIADESESTRDAPAASALAAAAPAIPERAVLGAMATVVFNLISENLTTGEDQKSTGYLPFLVSYLEQAAASPGSQASPSAAGADNVPAELEIAQFMSASAVHIASQSKPLALALSARARSIADAHPGHVAESLAVLVNVSGVLNRVGRPEEAMTLNAETIAVGRAGASDPKVFSALIHALNNQAHYAHLLQQGEVEASWLNELLSLALSEAHRDLQGASFRNVIGDTLRSFGRLEPAITSYEVAVQILEAHTKVPDSAAAAFEFLTAQLVTLARLYHHIDRKDKSQAIVDRLARLGYLIPDLPPPSFDEEAEDEAHGSANATAAMEPAHAVRPAADELGGEIGPVAKNFDLADLDEAAVTKN